MKISEVTYELNFLKKLERLALKYIEFDEFKLDIKKITISNAVDNYSNYKKHLDIIHERLKLIDNQEARKLSKDFDDALNGSYSIFDTL